MPAGFLHKINKNMQRNQGVKCFVHLLYDVTYNEFKTQVFSCEFCEIFFK